MSIENRLRRIERQQIGTGRRPFLVTMRVGETAEKALARYKAEGWSGPVIVAPEVCKTTEEWLGLVRRDLNDKH